MNLIYHLIILFIISINQSNSLDTNHYKEYYSTSTPYKEALTDLDNGKCIKFYRTFIGINLNKVIFCPSYVIDNEYNRKVLSINSSDYFYNNLDFKSLGNSIYERHNLINLTIKCDNSSQDKSNESSIEIESSNCELNTISINKQSPSYPLKSIIEWQYQINKDQIPTSKQFKSIYLKYLNSNDTFYIDVDLFRLKNKTLIGKVPDNHKKDLNNNQIKTNLNYINFYSNLDDYYVDETNCYYVYNKLALAYFMRRYQIETNSTLSLDSKSLPFFSKLKANESIYLIKLNDHSTFGEAQFKKTILILLFKHDFDLNIVDSENPIPHIGQILTRNEIQQSKIFLINQLYTNSKFESYDYNQLDLLYSNFYPNFLKQNSSFNITRLIDYTLNIKQNLNPYDLYLKSLILNREYETGKKLRGDYQLKIFNQFKDSTSEESNNQRIEEFYDQNKDLKEKIKKIISNPLFSINFNEFEKMYDNLYYRQLTELMLSE